MPRKTPEPEQTNLMMLEFTLEYRQRILLPYSDAAELMRLLEKAQLFTSTYDMLEANIAMQADKTYFNMSPMDMKTYPEILKAQVLGIPFGDYMATLKKEQNNGTE